MIALSGLFDCGAKKENFVFIQFDKKLKNKSLFPQQIDIGNNCYIF